MASSSSSSNNTSWTPVDDIPNIVQSCRDAFDSGKSRPLAFRKQQLNALIDLLEKEKEQYVQALSQDLRQIEILSESEVGGSAKEAELALSKLDSWIQPESKSLPLLNRPGSGTIVKEPFGVVLIIAPWNYPISLLLKPLVGALAAGNCVVVKPSEVSENCSDVLARTIPAYLDTDCVKVVTGGKDETIKLLDQHFDYIMYTGNGVVGRSVMKQAAKNLTPVTLELGGKSPCVIDEHVNLDVAVRRICWAKFLNAGQTCVAPDYILVTKPLEKTLLTRLSQTIAEFYGDEPYDSKDFSRIINSRHTQRIEKLIKTGNHKIVTGGKVIVDERYVAPTILTNVNPSDPVMQEEIFGPVLPVLSVDSVQDAVKFINARPKPLALYIFSGSNATQQFIINNTSSGGVAINDAIMQVVCPDLPFGGVGESGMGAYNGQATFETFTHRKSVLSKATWTDPSIRYPPYTESKVKWLTFLNNFKPNKSLFVALIGIPFLAAVIYQFFVKAAL